MSRIAKHALLPSLIATAFAGAAVADNASPTAGTTCARPTTQGQCPSCERDAATRSSISGSVRELLADGTAIDATRKAVRSILGTDLDDAEEAAQESALRAVRKDVAACCPRGLQRWLFRTAKNYILDTRRKKREQLFSAYDNHGDNDTERAMPLPATTDVGPLQILQLQDEIEATLHRDDLETLSREKLVQLGRALGDRLQSDNTVRHYLPRASALVEHARTVARELAPKS